MRSASTARISTRVSLGTKVVNNPFMWSADDKFFDASLHRARVASPKRWCSQQGLHPRHSHAEASATSSIRWTGRAQSST